jgi:hypothetical protein
MAWKAAIAGSSLKTDFRDPTNDELAELRRP